MTLIFEHVLYSVPTTHSTNINNTDRADSERTEAGQANEAIFLTIAILESMILPCIPISLYPCSSVESDGRRPSTFDLRKQAKWRPWVFMENAENLHAWGSVWRGKRGVINQ